MSMVKFNTLPLVDAASAIVTRYVCARGITAPYLQDPYHRQK